jgi:hypothetical protein
VIFQQLDPVATAPTLPLANSEQDNASPSHSNGFENHSDEVEDNTDEMVAVHPSTHLSTLTTQAGELAESAYMDPETGSAATEGEADLIIEEKLEASEHQHADESADKGESDKSVPQDIAGVSEEERSTVGGSEDVDTSSTEDEASKDEDSVSSNEDDKVADGESSDDEEFEREDEESEDTDEKTPVSQIEDAEERLNTEIEELLALLGLTQSMIQVTNEMIAPPEGHWEAPEGYRAIINPGGVGQPRDGDPRAAFMIFDTERGFEFYRIEYPVEKTQEKILKAGLPQYLAIRLAYGR